jgi:hypothetical protein
VAIACSCVFMVIGPRGRDNRPKNQSKLIPPAGKVG